MCFYPYTMDTSGNAIDTDSTHVDDHIPTSSIPTEVMLQEGPVMVQCFFFRY